MSAANGNGGIEPGLVFYQILKPTALKDANGAPQYALIGMSQDLGAALQQMQQTPGGAVTLTVCIAKNAPALLTPN